MAFSGHTDASGLHTQRVQGGSDFVSGIAKTHHFGGVLLK